MAEATLSGGQINTIASAPQNIPPSKGTVTYSDLGDGEYKTINQVMGLPTLLSQGKFPPTV